MQFCVNTYFKYSIIQFQGVVLILIGLYVLRISSITNIYNFLGNKTKLINCPHSAPRILHSA